MSAAARQGRIVAAALGVLVLSCRKEQPTRGPSATPVRVATAARIDAPVTILASGVVEPMQTVAVTTATMLGHRRRTAIAPASTRAYTTAAHIGACLAP